MHKSTAGQANDTHSQGQQGGGRRRPWPATRGLLVLLRVESSVCGAGETYGRTAVELVAGPVAELGGLVHQLQQKQHETEKQTPSGTVPEEEATWP